MAYYSAAPDVVRAQVRSRRGETINLSVPSACTIRELRDYFITQYRYPPNTRLLFNGVIADDDSYVTSYPYGSLLIATPTDVQSTANYQSPYNYVSTEYSAPVAPPMSVQAGNAMNYPSAGPYNAGNASRYTNLSSTSAPPLQAQGQSAQQFYQQQKAQPAPQSFFRTDAVQQVPAQSVIADTVACDHPKGGYSSYGGRGRGRTSPHRTAHRRPSQSDGKKHVAPPPATALMPATRPETTASEPQPPPPPPSTASQTAAMAQHTSTEACDRPARATPDTAQSKDTSRVGDARPAPDGRSPRSGSANTTPASNITTITPDSAITTEATCPPSTPPAHGAAPATAAALPSPKKSPPQRPISTAQSSSARNRPSNATVTNTMSNRAQSPTTMNVTEEQDRASTHSARSTSQSQSFHKTPSTAAPSRRTPAESAMSTPRAPVTLNIDCQLPALGRSVMLQIPDDAMMADLYLALVAAVPEVAGGAKIVYHGRVLADTLDQRLFNLGIRGDCRVFVASGAFANPDTVILVELDEEIARVAAAIAKPLTEVERKGYYEELMRLLFRTDGLQNLDDAWRQRRKDTVKRITALQDELHVEPSH